MTIEKKEIQLWDYVTHHKRLLLKHNAEFERIFGLRLGRYFEPILMGFNVLAFEKSLAARFGKTPDGTSLRDFIVQKFGKRAALLVEELISMPNGSEPRGRPEASARLGKSSTAAVVPDVRPTKPARTSKFARLFGDASQDEADEQPLAPKSRFSKLFD